VYSSRNALISSLRKEKRDLQKQMDDLRNKYLNRDSPENKLLQEIFSKAQSIAEAETTLNSAQIRVAKRNPPRDTEGHFGDAIIWESRMCYFAASCKKRKDSLILVSNDNKAWGDGSLNPWLQEEWLAATSCKIRLVNSVADIIKLTTKEQNNIRKKEQEELKQNLLADFINSGSFVGAGANANRLISIKSLLNKGDLEQILRASVANHEIFQSFFTQQPLLDLLRKEENVAIEPTNDVDDALWSRFCEMYSIKLWRPKEGLFQ
jgi:hypothetical protein